MLWCNCGPSKKVNAIMTKHFFFPEQQPREQGTSPKHSCQDTLSLVSVSHVCPSGHILSVGFSPTSASSSNTYYKDIRFYQSLSFHMVKKVSFYFVFWSCKSDEVIYCC